MSTYMVIDAESIGLYGPVFAVGYVVFDGTGTTVEEGLMACNPDHAEGGADSDYEWVSYNCPSMPYDAFGPRYVRKWFWDAWRTWANKGAQLWADCAYPVEANLLLHCVVSDPTVRKWHGPYPLHEIATAAYLCGYDPTASISRLPDEEPAHNPLHDARQSARLLIGYLRQMGVLHEG